MASLPAYEVLVRWTVVDTTKWLAENGLSEYKDSFKKEGVDGSKLAKLTDSDIDNLKSAPTKKRIQLKNAVANIDRSRVNSLPRTQGMMTMFRQTRDVPNEPAPPPRPPRARQPLPHETEPPTSHAPDIPSGNTEYDDDNEDAYSWGDDFYQSDGDDGDEDYINEKNWPQHDFNSNNIGFEEVAQNLNDDDDDDEDYEMPVSEPPVPARPPRPGQMSQPPARKPMEPPQMEKPPPRPSALSKPQPRIPVVDDDEDVYDEPDEQREKVEKERRRAEEKKRLAARQLPPVPSPSQDERPPPPTPRRGPGKRPSIPVPPLEPEETYEPMDAPQRTMPSRLPDPPKSSRSKPQPMQRASRPLPHVPPPTDHPVRKVRNAPVPPPVQRDELDIYDWYHKNIDRTTAEASLMDQQEDGMYLIRKSKRGGTEQQYTLTIYKQGRVYNLPIRKRKRDGKFALGAEKPNELDFDSVPNLVDYFKSKLIMLNPKARNASGSTRLMIAMPKY